MTQELQIVKKAWKVIDPVIQDHYISEENWETVYAETAGEAKTKCSEKENYINVKCRRSEPNDIVLHEGNEIVRHKLEHDIEETKRIRFRKNKVLSFPETEMFYIQNGYVGNSVSWWGLESRGYTTDITKAQKYTRQEVLKRFVNAREEDRIWAASHVDQHISQHVDSQYLNHQFVA